MKKEKYSNSKSRFNRPRVTFKIKVVAKDSKRVLIHDNVPYEHLELMKINPNLNVHVLEVRNGYSNKERK